MSIEHHPAKGVRRHRRGSASAYLKEVWGVERSVRTLAKLACTGGGPAMEYIGRFPTYTEDCLDQYAQSIIGPRVHSTSELREVA